MSPSLKDRAVTQYKDRQASKDINEKKQKTVCGETRDISRGSRRAKGYEDSLPDPMETSWRHGTEPRPHCKHERRI